MMRGMQADYANTVAKTKALNDTAVPSMIWRDIRRFPQSVPFLLPAVP